MKKSSILIYIIALAIVFILANFNMVTAQQTVEDQYWNAVKNSSDKEDFKSYLREYPNGKYTALARKKINPIAGQIGKLPPSNISNSILQTNMTRPKQTNKEFLATWQIEVKKKMPIVIDTIRFYSVVYRCPDCTYKSDTKKLSILSTSTDTSFAQMKSKIDVLKPALQKDYCASGAPQRRISFHLRTFLKSDSTQRYEYDIFPENCSGKLRETDIQVANNWAVETRKNYPFTFGDFIFTNAVSRCREVGCELQMNNRTTLKISVNTPNHSRQQVTKEMVEQLLKPHLLKDYCKSEPRHRGFQIQLNARDMNNGFIGRFYLRSTDCTN